MKTQQTAYFVDPGTGFGLDIERAAMVITEAREWDEAAAYEQLERDGAGWKILIAYGQLPRPTATLQAMSVPERYEMLLEVKPGFVLRTPRPAWATSTYSQSDDEGGDYCIHLLKLSPRGAVELILERTDTADPSGELHIGEPNVFLYVGDERIALTTHDLMGLSKAATAGAVQLD
ncbi:MAG TPA: hypothetical protein VJQ60_04615, partial [Arthrobacter sp.]|nr:hypothetical protein [Arthrobacter sp.]